MIAPSDLNRIPRWNPARLPEDLHRYVRTELAGEPLAVRARVRASTVRPGRFARLVLWLRPEAAPRSLAAEIGAVHFTEENEGALHSPGPVLAAHAVATSAFVMPSAPRNADREDLCACEQ